MATVHTPYTLADAPTARTQSKTLRAGWVVLGLAALAGIAFVLVEARTGAVASRVRNPNPIGTHIVGGAAYANKPFLGVTVWPQIFEWGSLGTAIVFWTFAIRQSLKQRHITPTLLMLIVTTLLVFFDPIMNWAPYASYDPRLLHFPETWAWASIAPTVEPVVTWIGYQYFFLVPAFITLAIYRRVIVPRVSERSLAHRRPVLTILFISLVVCIIWDGVIEALLTRMEIYSYTQVIGPLSIRAGTTWQFPLYEAVLFGGVLAAAAPLMHRNDRGLTWAEQVASRRPRLARHQSFAGIGIAFTLMAAIYVGYGLTYAVVRDAGWAKTVARPWPYQNTKVYDPQGHYQKSGEPGPYFKGIWSGWETTLGTR